MEGRVWAMAKHSYAASGGRGEDQRGLGGCNSSQPLVLVQKGCHFPVTRALVLYLKSNIFTCLKIKHVQGSMYLGLPTEYYLATRLVTTLLFFKINTMDLLNLLVCI